MPAFCPAQVQFIQKIRRRHSAQQTVQHVRIAEQFLVDGIVGNVIVGRLRCWHARIVCHGQMKNKGLEVRGIPGTVSSKTPALHCMVWLSHFNDYRELRKFSAEIVEKLVVVPLSFSRCRRYFTYATIWNMYNLLILITFSNGTAISTPFSGLTNGLSGV